MVQIYNNSTNISIISLQKKQIVSYYFKNRKNMVSLLTKTKFVSAILYKIKYTQTIKTIDLGTTLTSQTIKLFGNNKKGIPFSTF